MPFAVAMMCVLSEQVEAQWAISATEAATCSVLAENSSEVANLSSI